MDSMDFFNWREKELLNDLLVEAERRFGVSEDDIFMTQYNKDADPPFVVLTRDKKRYALDKETVNGILSELNECWETTFNP